MSDFVLVQLVVLFGVFCFDTPHKTCHGMKNRQECTLEFRSGLEKFNPTRPEPVGIVSDSVRPSKFNLPAVKS